MSRVELHEVSYRYPLGEGDALRDIDCAFEEGVVYGIIGPNGGGKTTLCDVVRGFIPHFHGGELRGDVLLDGVRVQDRPSGELATQVGYIFQNPFSQMSGVRGTVFEEIALGLENLGIEKETMIARVLEIAERVGVTHLLEKDPNALSGGQRQRVAVAAIVAMDAPVLVIDEPTSQLDPESSRGILDVVRDLRETGKTILLVEHKIDLLAEIADELLVIDDGMLIDSGPTSAVLARAASRPGRTAVPVSTRLCMRLATLPEPPQRTWTQSRQAIEDITARQAAR